MFNYSDWINLSDDFPDVDHILNYDLCAATSREYPDAEVIPFMALGEARIISGIPMPTIKAALWDDCWSDDIETLMENVYEEVGFSAVHVFIENFVYQIVFTGTAYVVQSDIHFDEGFGNISDAISYIATDSKH